MPDTGRIIYALYGAPPTGSNIGFNDVTALVSAQYAAGQVVFTATNENYGPDPDAGTVKSLIIVYAYSTAASLAPGIYPLNTFQTFTSTCPENGSITLPPANVPQTGTTTQLDSVINEVVGLFNSDPNLPGIASGRALAANAFGSRSEEDARLLAGRLYDDAIQTMTAVNSAKRNSSSPSPFSSDNIRQALQTPFSAARVELPDFNGLVADTRMRMQSDAGFAQRINESSVRATAARQACKCTINGQDAACWKCIIIIVIIIVIIVA